MDSSKKLAEIREIADHSAFQGTTEMVRFLLKQIDDVAAVAEQRRLACEIGTASVKLAKTHIETVTAERNAAIMRAEKAERERDRYKQEQADAKKRMWETGHALEAANKELAELRTKLDEEIYAHMGTIKQRDAYRKALPENQVSPAPTEAINENPARK